MYYITDNASFIGIFFTEDDNDFIIIITKMKKIISLMEIKIMIYLQIKYLIMIKKFFQKMYIKNDGILFQEKRKKAMISMIIIHIKTILLYDQQILSLQ